jgi:hypothetical protein
MTALWMCALPSAAGATQIATSDTLPVVATLSVWAEGVWLDLLDREGTIRGPLAEEGIFQRFHPLMDSEYTLDLRTGPFTPPEDAEWARTGDGIRAGGSSISHPHILSRVDWRQAFPVAESVDLIAAYVRDHSLTDRRDHTRLGVRWRDAGGSGWTVWSRIGVHFHKPAADLEAGLTRSWPAADGEGWRLELRAAALDVFSDVIFVGLGVDPQDVEAHIDHHGPPLAARAFVERRAHRWRVEAHGGISTAARSRVTFPDGSAPPFDLTEQVGFAGALVEVAPALGLTVAGYARSAWAEAQRTPPPEASADLEVTERTDVLGGYLRWRLTGSLAAEAGLHTTWRPETRIQEGASVRHEDRELYWDVALVRRPATGWTARLAYAGLDRDAGVLFPVGTARHHRLVTEGGYRTGAGFEVRAGVRWDLDELGRHSFDGGHLRLSAIPARAPGG